MDFLTRELDLNDTVYIFLRDLVLILHDSDYFRAIRTEGQAAILDLNSQNQRPAELQ
jgi:hypothetical protein